MGRAAVESALVAWVQGATGLTADKVILARQKFPVPPRPYVTIKLSPPRRGRSPHPIRVESFDAARPAGQEFEYRAVFEEERVVSLQAYTNETTGDATAPELLAAARRALGLEAYLAPLRAVGLAVLDPGDMQDLSAVVETGFQGRAALDVRFLAPGEAVERVGYVATIGLTGKVEPTPPDGTQTTVLGPDEVIDIVK